MLVDAYGQAPWGPEGLLSTWGRTHEGQVTFQLLAPQIPTAAPNLTPDAPLLLLMLPSSVAGWGRVLALAESVNNLHHL